MPKIRTKRTKRPEGWEIVEETLEALDLEMREAEEASTDGCTQAQALWPIFRINHQRSRYIYKIYYETAEISRELYDYLLREKYADAGLIAKWKKQGYEKLCCLACIITQESNFGTTCICRVPRKKLKDDQLVQCSHCGCSGCASGD